MSSEMLSVLILTLLIIVLILVGTFFLLMKYHNHLKEVLTVLLSHNRMLTNLATAKDLSAFVSLQHVPVSPENQQQQVSNFDPSFIPQDDASVAGRLAKQMSAQGLDPSNAYSRDDFNSEFGIQV